MKFGFEDGSSKPSLTLVKKRFHKSVIQVEQIDASAVCSLELGLPDTETAMTRYRGGSRYLLNCKAGHASSIEYAAMDADTRLIRHPTCVVSSCSWSADLN